MKVIITGAYGMLGKDVLKVMDEDPNFIPYPLEIRKNDMISHKNEVIADITDRNAVKTVMKDIRPDAVIHCAAYTDVKWCEKEENHKATDRLHVEATREIASYGTRLICISTDSVFDGKKGNYTEDAVPSPVTYYAKSKLNGEKAALTSNPNTLIVRTNIYGYHTPSRPSSFFVDGALSKLKANESISGYNNVLVNFIYTKQLAIILKELLISEEKGILNVASKETISKYGFLTKLADAFGCDRSLINEQSAPDSMNPGDTSLNINKLIMLLGIEPSINDGLKMLKKDMI